MGVPLVRRLGPGLPLRRAGPRRPRVRQGPAHPALPRVVHAPQRPAPGVRVELRRRQPARSTPGRRCGCSRSPATTTSTSWSASSTSCCSTSPGGSTARTSEGNNLFEGGFLGLDNIGPFDRSKLPGRRRARAVRRHGVDGHVLPGPARDGAGARPSHDSVYEDMATKFFEHFALIASALNDKGLWDEEDGFYYDVLRTGGEAHPAAGALGGRAAAPGRGHHDRARDDGRPTGLRRAAWSGSWSNLPLGQGRPRTWSPRRTRAGGCSRSSTRPSCGGCWRDARSRRVPLRPRPARSLAPPPPPAAARSRSAASPPRSTTSRPSRPPACSAATPTGAGRCGSPSTTC